MKRWVVAVTVFAVAAALVLVGVGIAYEAVDRGGELSAPVATAPADTPTDDGTDGSDGSTGQEAPDPALQSFYDQTLDWESCQSGFECASLTVPVDYADPGGETIDLALLKVAASGDRIGSLVVNPGGPGAPGTSYAAAADRVFRQPLLEAYDIVGFDPRGTGASSPVDCLSDDDLDDYLAMDPSPDTPGEERTYVSWSKRLGAGCVQNTGDLIAHVTTIEAARDMDVLRAALGEDQLDYFGASYGTKLGATYADLFPERVGRLVLDGALDLELPSRDITLGQAEGFERALTAYVQDCVDGGDCYLGDTVDAGLSTIKDFLADRDADPLPTNDDSRPLTEGLALFGIITPLYNRDYWYLLDTSLSAALRGDGSGLLSLADVYASRNPGGGFSDNSAEAIFAINCLDDPWAIPASQVADQVPAFEKASPTLGRTFAWMLTGCRGQVAESTEPHRDIEAEGAAPIVVVGTTRDPATPYEWAVSLADELESGVLVSRDGDGHTGYNSGNECVDEAIESYLVDGVVPDDGLKC